MAAAAGPQELPKRIQKETENLIKVNWRETTGAPSQRENALALLSRASGSVSERRRAGQCRFSPLTHACSFFRSRCAWCSLL